jgi:hypothetical protein
MMALWCFSAVASVGLAFLWAFCAREHSNRTRALTQLALTARLDDVVKDDSVHKVVETNLGYGNEFWTVPEGGMEIDRRARVVVNGRRITSELSPERTRRALLDGGKVVERMGVRF